MACTEYFSEADFALCKGHLPSKNITLGNATSGCLWSCFDFVQYCHQYIRMRKFDDFAYVDAPTIFAKYISPLGFLGSILLLLTLFSKRLKGTTFIFLQVIAFVQILQVSCFLMTVVTFLQGDAWLAAIVVAGRVGPSLKVVICILSLCLTFERYLAFSHFVLYSKVNTQKFLVASCFLSLLPVIMECEYFSECAWYQVELTENQTSFMYSLVRNKPWSGFYAKYISRALLGLKLIILFFMIYCNFAILWQIRRRKMKIFHIATAASAAGEYKNMVELSKFQIVDALVMIVDLGFSSVCDLRNFLAATNVLDQCSFSENFSKIRSHWIVGICAAIIQGSSALAHAELFVIYLVFFRKFRAAVFDLLKSVVRKCSLFERSFASSSS